MTRIHLHRRLFGDARTVLVEHGEITVTAHRYPTGVEAVTVENSRGHITVLPLLGQIVWAAEFDGVDMTMKNMFDQPHPASVIVDTYGCFAFHSGLLAAGCPAPEDDHPLHGEMPCAPIDSAWIDVDGDAVTVSGSYEYVQGFGHHYRAIPSTRLAAGEASLQIGMQVTNLSHYQPMPLQYMCHMNHAYLPGATFGGTLPQDAFRLRETVPAHVRPTPEWSAFNAALLDGSASLDVLDKPEMCDPEIVYFADDLTRFGEDIRVEMTAPDGTTFYSEFSATEFPVATRWILHNADQQVAAFCLPGTSRPEGRLAADAAGTLIQLAPGETRTFTVTTGVTR